jgi:hypothetical protein
MDGFLSCFAAVRAAALGVTIKPNLLFSSFFRLNDAMMGVVQ